MAVSPIYATLLVTFGTLAGRHRFFANMAQKIFGRFLPSFLLRSIGETFAYCVPGQPRGRGAARIPRAEPIVKGAAQAVVVLIIHVSKHTKL